MIENSFFRELFRGGYESWDGTAAAGFFYRLGDPRALPLLIKHNRVFGSGHTSVVVESAIEEIAKNPISQDDLQRVMDQMDQVDRRIVEQWILNPNSLFYKARDMYVKPFMIQQAQKYLAFEELALMAQEMSAANGSPIAPDMITNYFLNAGDEQGYLDFKPVNQVLIQNLDETAPRIARAKISGLKTISPELFSALVNPKDGNYFYYPGIVAKEVLGVSEGTYDKLAAMYQTKDLKGGAFARESFVEGLAFLARREDGVQILDSLMKVSKGASRDPEKMRRIFRQMQTLDSLGGFEKIDGQDLSEVSDNLQNKIIDIYKGKLDLDDEGAEILKRKLDKFVENGFLEIVTTLLARYEGNTSRVDIMKEISRHVIAGDFKNWREGLETSIEQLAVLPEDKRGDWLTPIDSFELSVKFSSEVEKRLGATEVIKRIATEAKAHVLDVFKMDFSDARLAELKNIRDELVRSLKNQELTDEKREIGIRKARIDGEIGLVEGLRYLEGLEVDELGKKGFMDSINKTIRAMKEFEGLEQPINDLEQIYDVLTTEKTLGEVQRLVVVDTDDPIDLLKVGIEPRETCQSWRQGSFNQCLPSNLTDANKRLINVSNDRGEVMARSIIKLTKVRLADGEEVPGILVEPTYTSAEMPELYTGVMRLALEKARRVGAVLILGRDQMILTGADQKIAVSVLDRETSKSGFEVERGNVEVYVPRSYNREEYSDSLGGLQYGGTVYKSIAASVARERQVLTV